MSASRRDVLAPGTALDGEVSLLYLDLDLNDDGADEPMTLHDAVADRADDPGTIAMRRIDWSAFWERLTDTEQYVLRCTAIGESVNDQAKHLGMSAPGIVYIKRRMAQKARSFWGDDLLADLAQRPAWLRELNAA
jgi:DNA-binding CsgD family transcriptional regulator